MAKGRKAQNELPDCTFCIIVRMLCTDVSNLSVIQLSDDRKKVRCNICEALRGQNGAWILKESLAYHLKSDVHARSIRAQEERDAIRAAGERAVQEECENEMNFAMLTSTIKPIAITKSHAPKLDVKEQEMWDVGALSNETFSAGIDYAAASAEERRRLAKEATDFDLWRGADYLPDEDPRDGDLLLDELEQDDILTELLRNASAYAFNNIAHTYQRLSHLG